ncbi:DUF2079 domain-containing protein [Prochlorococcus sp. MIT 1341]|uniref:DUF2079 domain-containing protein n=1 Tax=Prochlorococcus sp. MIT 1341 TaxID=3096221 RepID=UPI002A75DF7E|nr:DUF2079 domain-containing protein [Prochlorococcus sp. MIT 1341]
MKNIDVVIIELIVRLEFIENACDKVVKSKRWKSMAEFPIGIWLITSCILFIFSSLKHFLLGSSAWDLGIFEQFSWLISNGDINGISSLRGITPLQDHFSLLLLPIGIIYKLLPSTYTLLGLQSASLGAIPAISSYLCEKYGIPKKLRISLTIATAFSPIIFLVNIANFHPEVLVTPFMLLALVYIREGRYIRLFLLLFISLFAKKSQCLFGAGLAIYSFFIERKRVAFIIMLISIGWWFLAASFSSAGGDYIQSRLGYLGSENIAIINSLLFTPWKIFEEAPPDTILLYIIGLILPFSALINKKSLPAMYGTIPFFFINLISNTGTQRELYSQYSIGILPFIIVACIDCLKSDFRHNSSNLLRAYYLTIILTIVAFIGYSRIGYYQHRYFPRWNAALEFNRIKQLIPSDSSVLTSDHHAAHFSARKLIHNIEDSNYNPLTQYDYLVFPILNPNENRFDEMNSIIDSIPDEQKECVSNLKYFRVCSIYENQ